MSHGQYLEAARQQELNRVNHSGAGLTTDSLKLIDHLRNAD